MQRARPGDCCQWYSRSAAAAADGHITRFFFAFFPDAEIDGQAENDDDDDDDGNGNGQPLTTTISYSSKAFCIL